jgi:predicted phosphodiesterase
MRYAIFSDVHAYPPALERVLADAEAQQADMRICLGDVVGYGPDPGGAIALCREACDVVLAGNHDAAVARRIDSSTFIPRAQEAVNWHRGKISEDDIDWLARLPMSDVREDFISIHGELHMRDGRLAAGFGYVLDAFGAETVFMALPPEIGLVFIGHTHVADVWMPGGREKTGDFVRAPGGRYIVNVGAVGYPRFERETTYVIYDSDDGSVSFRHLPFDFEDYAQAMDAQGVEPPTWVADGLRAKRRQKGKGRRQR